MKPTNEELEIRVDVVADLICKLRSKAEIREECFKRWAVHWRTADRYMVRANEELKKRTRMSRDEARDIGVAVLIEKLRHGSDLIALRAEERLAAIFGYNAPKQLEVTGKDGQPLAYKDMTPQERRARLDEIFGRVAKVNGNGNGHHEPTERLIPERQ